MESMTPPFEAEKASGYYFCLNYEPWQGASVRIRRDGTWGEWLPLVDNGKALFWLGPKGEVTASAYAIKTETGEVVIPIKVKPAPED